MGVRRQSERRIEQTTNINLTSSGFTCCLNAVPLRIDVAAVEGAAFKNLLASPPPPFNGESAVSDVTQLLVQSVLP